MGVLAGDRETRFALATEAQRFIVAALPLQHPDSARALALFLERATSLRPRAADLHAVVLQTLTVLDRCTDDRIPSLVDHYLALGSGASDALARFRDTFEELLRYHGIRSPVVQRAVAIIHDRYAEPALSTVVVATELGRDPAAFAVLFKLHVGLCFHEYLRGVRLDRAANLLATTGQRVKGIWVSVGYNDGANFAHDFRGRFSVSPTQYRGRAVQPIGPVRLRNAQPCGIERLPPTAPTLVLIVDDDDCARDTLACCLRGEGHPVTAAATGGEALRVIGSVIPRVVLLDYHLPDMDGLRCLRELRQRTDIPQPAVALVTADWDIDEHADEIRALRGVIATKPLFAEEAHRLVRSLQASDSKGIARRFQVVPQGTPRP